MDIPRIAVDRTAPRRAAAIAALLAALALLYADTFGWMVSRWTAPASHFSHGVLVPLVSAVFAWRARGRLRWSEVPAARRGAVVLCAGALTYLAGTAVRVSFLTALSLVPVLAGLVLLFGGAGAWRALRFPVLFLLFLSPWPLWAVANLSLSAKLLTAETALRAANAVGIVAIRDGAVIHLAGGSGSLEIGDACSGLRYSVALLAFGAVLAHLSASGAWGRAAILLAALPAAILANAARVFLLVAAGSRFGAGAVEGVVHDLSGLLVFVVAFLLLTAVDPGRRPVARAHA